MSKDRQPEGGRAKVLRQRDRFIIFLPLELAGQVRALAEEGRRPLNTQFEMLVEEALEARKDLVAA